MAFRATKTNMNIKQANNLMVVPAKKAAVKYSWFFIFATSIAVTSNRVKIEIKINVVQKLLASKPVLPVYWSRAGGMAIMIIKNRKDKIELVIFIGSG